MRNSCKEAVAGLSVWRAFSMNDQCTSWQRAQIISFFCPLDCFISFLGLEFICQSSPVIIQFIALNLLWRLLSPLYNSFLIPDYSYLGIGNTARPETHVHSSSNQPEWTGLIVTSIRSRSIHPARSKSPRIFMLPQVLED